jgi:uncharacterized protein DUF6717
MNYKIKFYKDYDNKWYADLPEFSFSKEELEMISGADTMLEIISQGENEVILLLSDELFEKAEILTKVKDTPEIGRAVYIINYYQGFQYDLELWLCDVTKALFKELPNKIYLK